MLKQLRRKFVLVMMVLVTAMLTVVFGMVYYFTRGDLEEESLSTLRGVAAAPLRPGSEPRYAKTSHLPYFQVQLDQRGDIVAVEGTEQGAELDAILAAAGAQEEPCGVLEEASLRYLCAVSHKGTRLVFSDIQHERTTLAHLAQRCLLMGLSSFVGFLALSILLARWMVKPVEGAWQQQRQFVADASHELKTPLTVILTSAELLAKAEDPRARNLLVMARQMRVLVDRLLELARTEEERQAPLEVLDFSALAEESLLPFEAAFFEAGLILDSRLQPGIPLKGRDTQLRQLLPILLDNARKYAAAGSVVTVTLERTGRQCRLAVENFGEPIPPGELENIFKRFYRMDKARSRDGGFGLGLPIAREIVQGHKGRIWAESWSEGNRFLIELPCRGS